MFYAEGRPDIEDVVLNNGHQLQLTLASSKKESWLSLAIWWSSYFIELSW